MEIASRCQVFSDLVMTHQPWNESISLQVFFERK